MKQGLKIAIGSDHAGYEYKEILTAALSMTEVKDFGTYSSESVDYPDFAHPVANAIESGECDLGILICGAANGVAITANKHQNIRAAICWKEEIAVLARSHNNANIVCVPARFVTPEEATAIVTTFLNTEFEGGRHAHRVEKIACA
ncbi:ribose 5-phosphate isomerase B [Mucilaginibacter sp. SMC90]|uniref:ribose 5-phosphate isomerase B n=1 Tax=Mucilaginibacter sp. SMC90 TaxID=2929803 RepID=UPI001FB23DE0|nr:ribose 5-phosphate isomerase B [Mucilaginibacter sp. SMC90]UOE50078.1 ribose 5-phosphate isomerase B [Mucilaginibacter sp. SMC90]